MIRFIRHIFIFSVLLFFCLGLCEFYVRHQPDIMKERAEWIAAHGDSINTVYLGTSLTFWGVAPDTVNIREYNLAYNSQPPDASYYILKSQLENLPNLRKVYIEIAPFTLFDPPFEEYDLWHEWIKYTLYYGTDKHSRLSKYGFEISNPVEFRRKLLPWSPPTVEHQNKAGHNVARKKSIRTAEWQQSTEWVVKSHIASDWRWEEYNKRALIRLLEFCRSMRLETEILVFPAYKTYRERFDSRQLEEMYAFIEVLKSRFGVEVTDLYADERFKEDDFFDVAHLNNDVGAVKLWRILKEKDAVLKGNGLRQRGGIPND